MMLSKTLFFLITVITVTCGFIFLLRTQQFDKWQQGKKMFDLRPIYIKDAKTPPPHTVKNALQNKEESNTTPTDKT